MKIFKHYPILKPIILFLVAFVLSIYVFLVEGSASNIGFNLIDSMRQSMQVILLAFIDNKSFSPLNKWLIDIAQIFAIIAVSLSLFFLLKKTISHLRFYLFTKKHIVIIGLGEEGRSLVNNLLLSEDIQEKIVVIEQNKNNPYIAEMEEKGVIILIGDATTKDMHERAKLEHAKEIHTLISNDGTALEIASSFKKYVEDTGLLRLFPIECYLHIKSRSNRELFDINGLFGSTTDQINFYPFSFDEIIANRLFEKRPLTSTLKKTEDITEIQKYLIIGFGSQAEEILYVIQKLGHFTSKKAIEIKVLADNQEMLNTRYQDNIKIGKEQQMWNLSFESINNIYDKSIYINEKNEREDFIFNRIIMTDSSSYNIIESVSFFKKSFHMQMKEKETIVQVYNKFKVFGDLVVKDSKNMKLWYTFGEMDAVCSHELIKEFEQAQMARMSNNYKEIYLDGNISKAWENLDIFTKESNVTEKQHKNIKLYKLGLSTKSRSEEADSYLIKSKETDVKHLIKKLKDPRLAKYDEKKKHTFYVNLEKIYSDAKDQKDEDKKSLLLKIYKTVFNQDGLKIYNLPKLQEWLKSGQVTISNKEDEILKKIPYLIIKLYDCPGTTILKEEGYKELKTKNIQELSYKDYYNLNLLAGALELVNLLGDNETTYKLFAELASLEHTRWNAYHYLHGWKRKKKNETDGYASKDLEKKLHFDLTDFDTLIEEDSNVIKYDYKNIYHIPFLLAQENSVIVKNKD